MQAAFPYRVLLMAAVAALLSCSKGSGEDTATGLAGSVQKTFTIPVTCYVSDYSTGAASNWAVYPVAAFAKDESASRYTVRFYGFNIENGQEGTTISWKPGELPPAPWHPRQDLNDLVEGIYYIASGATWCNSSPGGTCNSSRAAAYQAFYQTEYGGKADITIEY